MGYRFEFLEFETGSSNEIRTITEMETSFTLKIRRSRIENIDSNKILKNLNKLMLEEKLFCDEDLKLERLAMILNIRTDQLSELINQTYSVNFNTYINDFRIEEAKTYLISKEKRDILSIAFACGFNSKSSFNSEFKKRTNLTPKQFKELYSHS